MHTNKLSAYMNTTNQITGRNTITEDIYKQWTGCNKMHLDAAVPVIRFLSYAQPMLEQCLHCILALNAS